jgi:hypothetical protein
VQLLLFFNAFRHYVHPKVARQADDRCDHPLTILIVTQFSHERAIDFQCVERELVQVIQA